MIMEICGQGKEKCRNNWNGCVKEENQCPPRCECCCAEPEDDEEIEPEEPDTGIPMRMHMKIDDWQGARDELDEILVEHSRAVEAGQYKMPTPSQEETRLKRSIFGGDLKVVEGALSA
jgi:hypothetical protein